MSSEPRPADRGRGFGAAQREAVAASVALYRRLFWESAGLGHDAVLRAGEAVGARLVGAYPDVVTELEGLAAGSGQDVRELLAINARTELLSGAGECSLVARGSWLAQTWDWHPESVPVVWTVEGAFTTVTEAGVLGKLGRNAAGVACGLNYLTCSADGGLDGGVPIHVLLRLILSSCDSAADARALLAGVETSASSCITVAAPDGLFAAELSPGGARFVEPGGDGWLVHTNHFLLAPVVGEDTMPVTHPGTLDRFVRLLRAARAGAAVPNVLSQHGAVVEPICRHADHDPPITAWAERRATVLAVWAPSDGGLRVAPGPPCETAFEDVR